MCNVQRDPQAQGLCRARAYARLDDFARDCQEVDGQALGECIRALSDQSCDDLQVFRLGDACAQLCAQ
jgi:hypothetical protein